MFPTVSAAFEGEDAPERFLRALDHPRRRAVLSALLDSTAPLGVDELCVRVGERVDAERETVALSLRHQHLPVLSEAGLIHRSERGIVLQEGYQTPVERTLEWIDGVAPEVWAEFGPLISDLLSRATVVELDERNLDTPIEVECLASSVAERIDPERSTESVATELHHVLLPKLEEAGVVEFDPENGIARWCGHSRSSIGTPGSILQTFSVVENGETRSRPDPPA